MLFNWQSADLIEPLKREIPRVRSGGHAGPGLAEGFEGRLLARMDWPAQPSGQSWKALSRAALALEKSPTFWPPLA